MKIALGSTLMIVMMVSVAPAQLGSYGLTFDGITSHGFAPDVSMDLSGNFTVECWVKFNGLVDDQVIVSKTADPSTDSPAAWVFGLWKLSTNKLRVSVGENSANVWEHIESSTTVTTGVWYHLAASMNGRVLTLYVNGVEEATLTIWLTHLPDDHGYVYFGMNPGYIEAVSLTKSAFNGVLDDVRIWGCVRTQPDIAAHMNAELLGSETGLQAYYKMNEGAGTTIQDGAAGAMNEGYVATATYTPSGPLPVTLTSFTGIAAQGGTTLHWSTASETNNYGYEVERRDGANGAWTRLGFVAGHGTTVAPQSYEYADAQLGEGQYAYRLKQIDLDGTGHNSESIVVTVAAGVTGVSSQEHVPQTTTLAQNFPNPFNPSTLIEFTLAANGPAKLVVYDMLGREVAILADGQFTSGVRHSVHFDGSRLTSGVYFYRLTADGKSLVHSLTLTK